MHPDNQYEEYRLVTTEYLSRYHVGNYLIRRYVLVWITAGGMNKLI